MYWSTAMRAVGPNELPMRRNFLAYFQVLSHFVTLIWLNRHEIDSSCLHRHMLYGRYPSMLYIYSNFRHSVIYSNYSESTSTDASVTIRSHLKECLRESAASDNTSRECPLAASLATALCRQFSLNVSIFIMFPDIGRARREGYRSARILVCVIC